MVSSRKEPLVWQLTRTTAQQSTIRYQVNVLCNALICHKLVCVSDVDLDRVWPSMPIFLHSTSKTLIYIPKVISGEFLNNLRPCCCEHHGLVLLGKCSYDSLNLGLKRHTTYSVTEDQPTSAEVSAIHISVRIACTYQACEYLKAHIQHPISFIQDNHLTSRQAFG